MESGKALEFLQSGQNQALLSLLNNQVDRVLAKNILVFMFQNQKFDGQTNNLAGQLIYNSVNLLKLSDFRPKKTPVMPKIDVVLTKISDTLHKTVVANIISTESHSQTTEFKIQILKETKEDNRFGKFSDDPPTDPLSDDSQAQQAQLTSKKKRINDSINAMISFQNSVFEDIKYIVKENLGPILHSGILSELSTPDQADAMIQLTQQFGPTQFALILQGLIDRHDQIEKDPFVSTSPPETRAQPSVFQDEEEDKYDPPRINIDDRTAILRSQGNFTSTSTDLDEEIAQFQEEKARKTTHLKTAQEEKEKIPISIEVKAAYKTILNKVTSFKNDEDKINFQGLKRNEKNFDYLREGLTDEFDECNILEKLQNYEEDDELNEAVNVISEHQEDYSKKGYVIQELESQIQHIDQQICISKTKMLKIETIEKEREQSMFM